MAVSFDAKSLGRWARQRNLRLLAHSRRIVFVMLPLGAFTGWMMGLAVKAYSAVFSWTDEHLVSNHLV
ncbi:MAG TPA: hypothetical protein VFM16_01690, partial [Holophagaceae bacterium]|nr:hypothetical protein [Holophagaceae bacterium]